MIVGAAVVLQVRITENSRRRLRVMAALRGCRPPDLVQEAIADLLALGDLPPRPPAKGRPHHRLALVWANQYAVTTPAVRAQLDVLAARHRVSRTDLVRQAIDDLLTKHDGAVAAGAA